MKEPHPKTLEYLGLSVLDEASPECAKGVKDQTLWITSAATDSTRRRAPVLPAPAPPDCARHGR